MKYTLTFNQFLNEENLTDYNDQGKIDNYYVYQYDKSGNLEPYLRIDPNDGQYKPLDAFENPTKYSKKTNQRKFLSKMFYEELRKEAYPKRVYYNNHPFKVTKSVLNNLLWDVNNEIFAKKCNECQKFIKIENYYFSKNPPKFSSICKKNAGLLKIPKDIKK